MINDSASKRAAPRIGQMVTFHQSKHETSLGNGVMEHPAVITRAWGHDCVNLKVFPDCGSIVDRTSVPRAFHGGNAWGFSE